MSPLSLISSLVTVALLSLSIHYHQSLTDKLTIPPRLSSPTVFTPADANSHLLGDNEWKCPPGGCNDVGYCSDTMNPMKAGEFCTCTWPKNGERVGDGVSSPDPVSYKNWRGSCIPPPLSMGEPDDNIHCSVQKAPYYDPKKAPIAVAKGSWHGLLCPE